MNRLHDQFASEWPEVARQEESFLEDVLTGLAQIPPSIPSKYLYDSRGSELFDQICTLEVYYPTRTELGIMAQYGPEIGRCVGPGCRVVELGSGSGNKTRALLDHLEAPVAYYPVEIARTHLLQAASYIEGVYPELEILPVCADYTQLFELPPSQKPPKRTLVYFPGSTLGNFDPEPACDFLQRIAALAGPGGALLLGVDLVKDREVLETAYNDPQGVTAAFNLNLLERLRRELDAEIAVDGFSHRAHYNQALGCIEMHLVSRQAQTIRVGGQEIRFRHGDTILTERSYKYTLAGFRDLALRSGFEVLTVWMDNREFFSVQYLGVHSPNSRQADSQPNPGARS